MPLKPIIKTKLGCLYEGDCLEIMPQLPQGEFDLVFADPPFNLGKVYNKHVNDNIPEAKYIEWCKEWLIASIALLRDGGALFAYNLPKWNVLLGSFLSERLTFRHWITVDMKYTLPIQGRLYPSHYSLLYFVKGKKAGIFHPDRLPIETTVVTKTK